MNQKQKLLPAKNGKKKMVYPAKVNIAASVAAGRRAGIKPEDIRRILNLGKLGRTIPDREMKEIAKGVKVDRYAMIKKALEKCDKRLLIKDLPDDIWIAINKAKAEYLSELSQLTSELDEVGRSTPSPHDRAMSPHSFGPREQIGNVTAVQVTIGQAQEPPAQDEKKNLPRTDIVDLQSAPPRATMGQGGEHHRGPGTAESE